MNIDVPKLIILQWNWWTTWISRRSEIHSIQQQNVRNNNKRIMADKIQFNLSGIHVLSVSIEHLYFIGRHQNKNILYFYHFSYNFIHMYNIHLQSYYDIHTLFFLYIIWFSLLIYIFFVKYYLFGEINIQNVWKTFREENGIYEDI